MNILNWIRNITKSKDPARKTSYIPLVPMKVKENRSELEMRIFRAKQRLRRNKINEIVYQSRKANRC